jgi:hypothetical protein
MRRTVARSAAPWAIALTLVLAAPLWAAPAKEQEEKARGKAEARRKSPGPQDIQARMKQEVEAAQKALVEKAMADPKNKAEIEKAVARLRSVIYRQVRQEVSERAPRAHAGDPNVARHDQPRGAVPPGLSKLHEKLAQYPQVRERLAKNPEIGRIIAQRLGAQGLAARLPMLDQRLAQARESRQRLARNPQDRERIAQAIRSRVAQAQRGGQAFGSQSRVDRFRGRQAQRPGISGRSRGQIRSQFGRDPGPGPQWERRFGRDSGPGQMSRPGTEHRPGTRRGPAAVGGPRHGPDDEQKRSRGEGKRPEGESPRARPRG